MISQWANAKESWNEKDYATTDVIESFFEDKESTAEEYITKTNNLLNSYESKSQL